MLNRGIQKKLVFLRSTWQLSPPMHHTLRFRLGLISLFTVLPTLAVATTTSLTFSEPQNGFIHGMNIEWNARHMQLFDAADHAAFHGEWDAAEREWLEQHLRDADVEDTYRTWIHDRNAAHRAWHMTFSEATTAERISAMMPLGSSRRHLEARARMLWTHRTAAATTNTIIVHSQESLSLRPRWYTAPEFSAWTGNRPQVHRISRRLLRAATRAQLREQMNALPAVGKR